MGVNRSERKQSDKQITLRSRGGQRMTPVCRVFHDTLTEIQGSADANGMKRDGCICFSGSEHQDARHSLLALTPGTARSEAQSGKVKRPSANGVKLMCFLGRRRRDPPKESLISRGNRVPQLSYVPDTSLFT